MIIMLNLSRTLQIIQLLKFSRDEKLHEQASFDSLDFENDENDESDVMR